MYVFDDIIKNLIKKRKNLNPKSIYFNKNMERSMHIALCFSSSNKKPTRYCFGKSVGCNKYVISKYNKQIVVHAEMDAIRNFINSNTDMNSIDILVIRINKQGELQNSLPCDNCINGLRKLNMKIKHIHYSNDNAEIETIKFNKCRGLAPPTTLL